MTPYQQEMTLSDQKWPLFDRKLLISDWQWPFPTKNGPFLPVMTTVNGSDLFLHRKCDESPFRPEMILPEAAANDSLFLTKVTPFWPEVTPFLTGSDPSFWPEVTPLSDQKWPPGRYSTRSTWSEKTLHLLIRSIHMISIILLQIRPHFYRST
jgi:hypothetical protein